MTDTQNNLISYGNFQNPLGLVWRMLRSGHRAAYSALFREALGIALKPLDLLLSLREPTIASKSEESSDYPIILLVGPPRGGTTFVSQVLAHALHVSYPTNLMALFPKAPITASRWLGRFLGKNPPRTFHSYFGQTYGLGGLHDGFFIWNRWLGEDRYEAKQLLSDDEQANMRAFFAKWAKANPLPLLNKNNRNTDCIAQLAAALPNAVVVVVRRERHAIVRSLVNAREQVQGSKQARWGLRSVETRSNAPLQYVVDVCSQVLEIERRVDDQLNEIAPERIIETSYEAFCQHPNVLIDRLITKIPKLERRPNAALADKFTPSAGRRLSDAEEAKIEEQLDAARKSVTNQ